MFTLADGKDISLRASVNTTNGVKISASGNTTKSDITGTDQADIISGSAGADAVGGELGADTIDVGSETDQNNKVLLESIATADTITNFTTGASKDEIQFDVTTINAELADLTASSTLLSTAGSAAAADLTDGAANLVIGTVASNTTGSIAALPSSKTIYIVGATTATAAMGILTGAGSEDGYKVASGTVQDGDAILVGFEDANDNFVFGAAILTTTNSAGTVEDITTATFKEIATLSGTYAAGDFDTSNLATV